MAKKCGCKGTGNVNANVSPTLGGFSTVMQ